jgi:hypothetical protein
VGSAHLDTMCDGSDMMEVRELVSEPSVLPRHGSERTPPLAARNQQVERALNLGDELGV